jgi:GTP-binding nuclear protein Ran
VEVQPLTIRTTHGPIKFHVWDTAGNEKFVGLGDGYYIESKCAMVMFDLTSKDSFDEVARWGSEVISVAGNIPMVVGNKSDGHAAVLDGAILDTLPGEYSRYRPSRETIARPHF